MGEEVTESGSRHKAFERLRYSILCRRDVPISSAKDVIGWWESRRVPFNLIVGTAGILTTVIVGVVGLGSSLLFGSDFGLPDPPLFAVFGILIYAIMANVCYTGGWIAELIVRTTWPEEADRFATLSLSTGLAFSVSLTLAPGIVVGAGGVFGLIAQLSRVLRSH
jgi:hypothetical protein